MLGGLTPPSSATTPMQTEPQPTSPAAGGRSLERVVRGGGIAMWTCLGVCFSGAGYVVGVAPRILSALGLPRRTIMQLWTIRFALQRCHGRTQVFCLRLQVGGSLPLRETLLCLVYPLWPCRWPGPYPGTSLVVLQKLALRLSAGLNQERVDRAKQTLLAASEAHGGFLW